MEGLNYRNKQTNSWLRLGSIQMYVTGYQHFDGKVGRITFENLDALTKLLTAQDTDEIGCAYFGRETIGDFKRRLREISFAIYLSIEDEVLHEGSGGLKTRMPFNPQFDSSNYTPSVR